MGVLDDLLARSAHGAPPALLLVLAALLGLRHAADPDHLAAVTSLIAGDRERRVRRAAQLGLAWGTGHGLALVALGLPIVVLGASLPPAASRAAEAAAGVVVCLLALRLLRRWRRGAFHVHEHTHEDGSRHRHLHTHEGQLHGAHGHGHARSPLAAAGIGVLHGAAGSGAVAVLLLVAISGRGLAAASLVLFAVCTALSMWGLSTLFALMLTRGSGRGFERVAPALGCASLAVGAWLAVGALVP